MVNVADNDIKVSVARVVQIVCFAALIKTEFIFEIDNVFGFAVDDLRRRIFFLQKFGNRFRRLVGDYFLAVDEIFIVSFAERFGARLSKVFLLIRPFS